MKLYQSTFNCDTSQMGFEKKTAQLFSTNAFSTNTFSLNVLSSFTAIYSQSIMNTNNFFVYFYQRKQVSRE